MWWELFEEAVMVDAWRAGGGLVGDFERGRALRGSSF